MISISVFLVGGRVSKTVVCNVQLEHYLIGRLYFYKFSNVKYNLLNSRSDLYNAYKFVNLLLYYSQVATASNAKKMQELCFQALD